MSDRVLRENENQDCLRLDTMPRCQIIKILGAGAPQLLQETSHNTEVY